VKKNQIREPFQREKIRAGLERACWKRPISPEQIEAEVAEIERRVYDRFEDEVDSHTLGELVMERLGKLDQVAFVRFASVYREFKDVRDFVEELQPMLERPS
jgi:transcriptional repressor NrdR